jgi:hypothetical protein
VVLEVPVLVLPVPVVEVVVLVAPAVLVVLGVMGLPRLQVQVVVARVRL